jgi:hypothetical protein
MFSENRCTGIRIRFADTWVRDVPGRVGIASATDAKWPSVAHRDRDDDSKSGKYPKCTWHHIRLWSIGSRIRCRDCSHSGVDGAMISISYCRNGSPTAISCVNVDSRPPPSAAGHDALSKMCFANVRCGSCVASNAGPNDWQRKSRRGAQTCCNGLEEIRVQDQYAPADSMLYGLLRRVKQGLYMAPFTR